MRIMQDKIVIITGSTAGIGLAGAKRFLEEGAKVAVCGRNKEKLDNAIAELYQYGDVSGYIADIGNIETMEAMVNDIVAKHGRVDVLINNAAIIKDSSFAKMSDDTFENVINVNLIGTYRVTKLVLPHMMEHGGAIINVSSISALMGTFGQSNYAASKGAIISMSKVLSREVGKYGIRVNTVSPGGIWTDMYKTIPEDQVKEREKAIPLRRFGEPSEVANLYLFLASDQASYITGQNIVIDGGRI